MNLERQKLLIIAPHPDDEVIGCGGLIQKIKKAKGKVFVLYLTVGDSRDFSRKGNSSLNERLEEVEKVAKELAFDDYEIALKGNNYHLKLDRVSLHILINLIERKSTLSLEKIRPTMVAFPQIHSYNQDHQVAAKAALAALRPAEKTKHFVNFAISYEMPAELWSLVSISTPNFYLSLTLRELERKLSAFTLYKSQQRVHPNPRSIKNLKHFASLRGSHTGSAYAEGFNIHRFVLK